MRTNHRAAVAIIRDRQVLLIHRRKGDKQYFIFPGGGVESSEKPKEAAIREVEEELSLKINNNDLYFWTSFENYGKTDHYYITTKFAGKFNFLGDDIFNNEKPEGEKINDNPVWVRFADIEKVSLMPKKIKELLMLKSVIF